jgi:hypothetical protein
MQQAFLNQFGKKSLKTASKIPIVRKGYIRYSVGSRCTVIRHLSKPKKANLTSTPLRNIEKLVEASTWAFGNQP